MGGASLSATLRPSRRSSCGPVTTTAVSTGRSTPIEPFVTQLSIGFIEPHLRRYGGIRRVVELSNALIQRGHQVTIYVPEWEHPGCTWMRCDGTVKSIPDGFDDRLDVLVFNHEPQWHLLSRFHNADLYVFYALHYSKLYGKEGSWEALRAPVHLCLANSTWTAEMIEAEIAQRPHVLLGGINADHFRPLAVPKRYPLLCVGDDREWKGTDDLRRAADLVGLPLESYAGKDLDQSQMAAEYGAAEIFLVGSYYEGFGQPGLEALACGVPLVTTDNGGCRDYAIDGQTALVVPPGDPPAMAQAIKRLRREPDLGRCLVQNGLELVGQRFTWPGSAARFEHVVRTALADRPALLSTGANLREHLRDDPPRASVVVLAWDEILLSQRCVETIRQHTDVPYELVIVDNGSMWEAANYAAQAADVAILNDHNRGFAAGMNQGLTAAQGDAVVFLNNDTEVPEGWLGRLLATLESHPEAGIVVPALTAAGNGKTVRDVPGEGFEYFQPFEAPPSGVVYVMPTDLARRLGGFGEEYETASGEDIDLAFKVWVNDLDIIYDRRVLVDHLGHGTSDVKLDDRAGLWSRNRAIFFEKWSSLSTPVPRLDEVPQERFARNRRTAAAVAGWMQRFFQERDRRRSGESRARLTVPRSVDVAPPAGVLVGAVRAIWSMLRRVLPHGVRYPIYRRFKDSYYKIFPERHPAVLRGERRVPAREHRR